MKILKEKSGYTIENTDEIKNNESLADLLHLFVDEQSELIFSCDDIEYFFDNLQNEDIKTQTFYRKLIEYNKNRNQSMFLDNEEEKEKREFIKKRTVFINDKSNFPLQCTGKKKRRTMRNAHQMMTQMEKCHFEMMMAM